MESRSTLALAALVTFVLLAAPSLAMLWLSVLLYSSSFAGIALAFAGLGSLGFLLAALVSVEDFR